MGTDIIYQAEQHVEGKWQILRDEAGEKEFFYFGGERNYELYEILCGSVEPDTGLTSRGFVPIAPLRGAPDDYPPNRDYEEDGYSWLLLQELIDYPWQEGLRHFRGYANAENYHKFLNDERFKFSPVSPKHPYSPVPFPKPEWNIVSNEEMLDLIVDESAAENTYTEIEFTRSYATTAPYILTDTIPKLQRFGDPHEIRIVFSFFS